MLRDPTWTDSDADTTGVHISQILQIPQAQRTAEQTSTLVKWLMSVWPIAEQKGYRVSAEMAKSFKFFLYQEGDDILVEGERGLTFYIMVSGTVSVIKNNIGKVASLGMGKSFGEIALLEGEKDGKDVRTATIRAETKVEIISLHKLDYDRFVKDIHAAEKRENFQICRDCKLFASWNRNRIEKVSALCTRVTYAPGEYVFRQGAPADNIYIVLEGVVQVIKEILIINRNKWPTGMNRWSGMAKKTVSSFVTVELSSGAYFGELGVVKNMPRSASILAKTTVLCLSLGRDEFLHMLGPNSYVEVDKSHMDYKTPLDEVIKRVNGGPSSTLTYDGQIMMPNASKPAYLRGKSDNITARAISPGIKKPKERKSDAGKMEAKAKNVSHKSSRDQKFAERFYKDVTKKDEIQQKLTDLGSEAVKLAKTRKDFLNRIQAKKSNVNLSEIGIASIVKKFNKAEGSHSDGSGRTGVMQSLSFEGQTNSSRGHIQRAKTAGSNVTRGDKETVLPSVIETKRPHSEDAGVQLNGKGVVFTPIDRGLNINRGD